MMEAGAKQRAGDRALFRIALLTFADVLSCYSDFHKFQFPNWELSKTESKFQWGDHLKIDGYRQ